MTVAAFSKPVF